MVDGEEASAGVVSALQDEGSVVLAYLSVGTIEKWRSWYDDLRRYRLSAWQDWKDEWFADVSKGGLRDALADEIAPGILAKGFDGLFLDNVDMIEPKRHKKQRDGMRELVARLGEVVHSDDGLLFAQNGYWGSRVPAAAALDGWNREDVTWAYDFDRSATFATRDRGPRRALMRSDLAAAGRSLRPPTTPRSRRRRQRSPSPMPAPSARCPYVSDIGLPRGCRPPPYVSPTAARRGRAYMVGWPKLYDRKNGRRARRRRAQPARASACARDRRRAFSAADDETRSPS